MERLNTARKRAREVRSSRMWENFYSPTKQPREKCGTIIVFYWDCFWYLLDYWLLYLVFLSFFWCSLEEPMLIYFASEQNNVFDFERFCFGIENSGRLRWWKCCSKNASKNMTRYKIYMSCVVFVIRTARLFLKKVWLWHLSHGKVCRSSTRIPTICS